MLVQMSVAGMILDDDERSFSLLLKETEGETIVSIQIDQPQAESIAILMDSAFTRLPDPYDFLSNIMDSFALRMTRVVIKNLKRYSKNADVFLSDGEREVRIEAHTGDAVASAILVDAPIFIESNSLETSHKRELKKWLSKVRPSDFGKI
jgi:bifunctional DNase/RNase